MSTPYLHAAWLTREDHAEGYLKQVGSVDGVVQAAAFRAEGRSEAMQTLAEQLSRLDLPKLRDNPPQAWVLLELESMAPAVEIGELLGQPDATRAVPVAEHVLNHLLFHEINDVPGPVAGDGGFAPAHQFGVLEVNSIAAEWQLHAWYERRRLLECAEMPGMIRTRRYSVVAGPAKYGILYEFPSIDARLEGFEALTESKGLDPSHPNAALRAYTVHTPGAPFIGSRIA